jgi:imidazole glycerol phosphate synthase glutamine amidotransferase subunit
MSEKPTVYLVRTGVANLGSITAGVARAGGSPVITEDSSLIASAPLAIVPGVGSFGQAMQGVNSTPGLLGALQTRIKAGLPTMFVCVGLQILAKASEESVGAEGLGLLDTTVIHFPTGVHVPQQGWNLVAANQSNYITSGYAYFSNSYCVPETPDAAGWNVSFCKHGIQFAAAFEFGALLACQFHPELSGEWGLKVMSNWIAKSPSLIRPVECMFLSKYVVRAPSVAGD